MWNHFDFLIKYSVALLCSAAIEWPPVQGGSLTTEIKWAVVHTAVSQTQSQLGSDSPPLDAEEPLRWFRCLARMPLRCLPTEVPLACLARRRLQSRPRTSWRGYFSHLAWECCWKLGRGWSGLLIWICCSSDPDPDKRMKTEMKNSLDMLYACTHLFTGC